MIPEFPEFKKLELSDKKDVEDFTSKFPPYSDFNFVSMWSWDIKGEMRISQLNNNLVVRFTDYITGEPFFSFLGSNEVNNTIEKLFELSKKEGFKVELKLVPEDAIKNLDNFRFKIVEDGDHFDYIYSGEKIKNLEGAEYSDCRRQLNNFTKLNTNIRIEDLDLKYVKNRMQVLKLNALWKANKEFNFNNENEDSALMRLLNSAESITLANVGIFVGAELVAFTINEKLHNHYFISHFAKFNTQYRGAYIYSMKITSVELLKQGYKYINCEQDLGLIGLRKSKQSLRPISYLKKYILTKNDLI